MRLETACEAMTEEEGLRGAAPELPIGFCKGYIGIMEKQVETAIMGYIGVYRDM